MPNTAPCFRSAFTAGHVYPADVLAFHRTAFGATRMEVDPATSSPPVDPSAGGESGTTAKFKDPDTGESFDFPVDTPISNMTEAQKSEYWRHKARKHEGAVKARADYDAIKAERDQLKSATQTETEKAIEAARAEERGKVEQETAGRFQARIVAAEVKAALAAAKFPADKIAGQVEFLDHSKFLTASGEVDADKVKQYADGLVPAGGGQWPDMGGGNRGSSQPTRHSSVSAVMQERAEARAAKTK